MYLTAEFLEGDRAVSGVSSLLAAGFDRDQIEVYSARPLELPKGMLERPSRMSLAAVVGALLNAGLATAFIFYTQLDYPLPTGGMPLVSGWATGVITYAMIMAGAVAGTVLAFLWESRLLRRRRGPAPPLRDRSVFVRVRCDAGSASRAAECLARSGAADVDSQEEK